MNSTNQAPSPPPILRIRDLRKAFGKKIVLDGIDIDIERGCAFTVMGLSGAGKSILLKCLADIVQPDAGFIEFNGKLLNFSDPQARADFHKKCSFLFQGNALFDSLTALQNVGLPLEQTTDLSDSEIRERSMAALEQLELAEHSDHYPSTLSGGMQKRLALARAIVTRPQLVFFDEPTAGLDPLRRNAVFSMIAKYRIQFDFTAIVVTHDVAEALIASDRVALLDHGRIRFTGTPDEFAHSTHPVVCSFRDSASALRSSLAAIRRGETINDIPEEDISEENSDL